MHSKGIMYEMPEDNSPKNAASEKIRKAEEAAELDAKRKKWIVEAQHQMVRDRLARNKVNKFEEREVALEKLFETMRIAKKRLCARNREETKTKKIRAAKREAIRAADDATMTPEELKMEQQGGAESDNPCWTR